MKHSMHAYSNFCMTCGHSYEEILDHNETECSGQIGVIHPDFIRKLREAKRLFDPIAKEVFKWLEAKRDEE